MRFPISAKMLRQLLTILALFSGLAAVAQPAQAARLASAVESSTAQSVQGPSCSTVRAQGILDDAQAQGENPRETFCTNPTFTVYVPTIMLRVDRAHE